MKKNALSCIMLITCAQLALCDNTYGGEALFKKAYYYLSASVGYTVSRLINLCSFFKRSKAENCQDSVLIQSLHYIGDDVLNKIIPRVKAKPAVVSYGEVHRDEVIKKIIPFGYEYETKYLCFYENGKRHPLIDISPYGLLEEDIPELGIDFCIETGNPIEFSYSALYPPTTNKPYSVSPDQCMVAGPNQNGCVVAIAKVQDSNKICRTVKKTFFDLNRIKKRYTIWDRTLPFSYKGRDINIAIQYLLALHDTENKLLYINDKSLWAIATFDTQGTVINNDELTINQMNKYRPFKDKVVFVGRDLLCAAIDSKILFYNYQKKCEICHWSLGTELLQEPRASKINLNSLNCSASFSDTVIAEIYASVPVKTNHDLNMLDQEGIITYAVALSPQKELNPSILASNSAVRGDPRSIKEVGTAYWHCVFSDNYSNYTFPDKKNSLYQHYTGRRFISVLRDYAVLQDKKYAHNYIDIRTFLSEEYGTFSDESDRHFAQIYLISKALAWKNLPESNKKGDAVKIMRGFFDTNMVRRHERIKLIAQSGSWKSDTNGKWIWQKNSSPFCQMMIAHKDHILHSLGTTYSQ